MAAGRDQQNANSGNRDAERRASRLRFSGFGYCNGVCIAGRLSTIAGAGSMNCQNPWRGFCRLAGNRGSDLKAVYCGEIIGFV